VGGALDMKPHNPANTIFPYPILAIKRDVNYPLRHSALWDVVCRFEAHTLRSDPRVTFHGSKTGSSHSSSRFSPSSSPTSLHHTLRLFVELRRG